MENNKKTSKIKLTRKKIALGFLVLFLLIGFVVSRNIKQKPVIRNTLSDRSKEFLKSQKFAPNSKWGNINLEGSVKEDTRNQRVGKENCYSFIIPYRVSIGNYDEQPSNKCYMRLSFDSPRGATVTYMYDDDAASFDDIAPVVQRRRDTDQYYPEEQKTLGGKTFVMFKGKTDAYEKSAFYFTPSYVFVFNLITRTNENLDLDFDQMLSTLDF